MTTPNYSMFIDSYDVKPVVEDVKAIMPFDREQEIDAETGKLVDFAAYSWDGKIGKGLMHYSSVAHAMSQEGRESLSGVRLHLYLRERQLLMTSYKLFVDSGSFSVSREHKVNVDLQRLGRTTDEDARKQSVEIVESCAVPNQDDWNAYERLVASAKRHHQEKMRLRTSDRVMMYLLGKFQKSQT